MCKFAAGKKKEAAGRSVAAGEESTAAKVVPEPSVEESPGNTEHHIS